MEAELGSQARPWAQAWRHMLCSLTSAPNHMVEREIKNSFDPLQLLQFWQTLQRDVGKAKSWVQQLVHSLAVLAGTCTKVSLPHLTEHGHRHIWTQNSGRCVPKSHWTLHWAGKETWDDGDYRAHSSQAQQMTEMQTTDCFPLGALTVLHKYVWAFIKCQSWSQEIAGESQLYLFPNPLVLLVHVERSRVSYW